MSEDEENLPSLEDLKEEQVPKRKRRIFRELLSIFFIVFGVFIFRSMFFEPFRIPSGSMIPTLMIGDFILVNKFSYGLKVPFSDLSLLDINWDPIYLFGKSHPKRGDVVVFKQQQEQRWKGSPFWQQFHQLYGS